MHTLTDSQKIDLILSLLQQPQTIETEYIPTHEAQNILISKGYDAKSWKGSCLLLSNSE